MLLRHTGTEVQERTALTINPAKTCQPIGAMYASLGVHGCLPHSHGSQGCCAYHRSALTKHYKEPIMAATSSFTEGSSVFGGQANLLQAITNIFSVYDPKIISVHSTCLSETIGDDLVQIVNKAQEEGKIPKDKKVVTINTPSYVGSHVLGYANALKNIVKQLARQTDKKTNKGLNVIAGWIEPSDYLELKKIVGSMTDQFVLLPDTSGVLDGPLTGKHQFYPDGGTTVEQIESMGDAGMTLAVGRTGAQSAAR